MRSLAGGGVTVDVPNGWDAQIRVTEPSPAARSAMGAASAPIRPSTVLHAGSFALPPNRGDYGSGAVELMGGSDILVCLLEGDPADVDTPLYRHRGLPAINPADFSPQTMQRAVAGMAGTQHFFTEAGRAFCLYVVVGSHRTRGPLARTADSVVRSIRFAP